MSVQQKQVRLAFRSTLCSLYYTEQVPYAIPLVANCAMRHGCTDHLSF